MAYVYYIENKKMKLVSTMLFLMFSVFLFSQDSIKCSPAPNVFVLDSNCYDFDYVAIDAKIPFNYYGKTSEEDLYSYFMFFPKERYAEKYNVSNKYIDGVECKAVWESVSYGSQALIANYFLREFVAINVYEYHYFRVGSS